MKKQIKINPDFLKENNLTEKQFLGQEKISGDLDLRSLTSIPDGFNPTVGGDLDLRSLTSIPDGFNPTVGGHLDLNSVTSIPDGFNPTVGESLCLSSLTSIPDGFNPTVGFVLDLRSLTSIPDGFNPTVGWNLYLSSLTSIPDGFNPTVGGNLHLSSLTSIPDGFNPTVGCTLHLKNSFKAIGASININFFWNKNGKKYAKIDGIFCEIISEKETTINDTSYKIFTAKKVNKDESFIIVNKDAYYSHGTDIKKAFEDLEFKIASEKI